MIEFTEHPDRYEANVQINEHLVTVSTDKPVSQDTIEYIKNLFKSHGESLISNSMSYYERKKEEYHVGYIDDLADPQIIVEPEIVSVYWYSEKGEKEGNSVIGVEFIRDTLRPHQLIIGD